MLRTIRIIFYEGEIPERGFFIRQAREFDFDLHDYLSALDRVPVFTREKVEYILEYNKALVGFITDIATQSLEKRKTDEALLKQQYFLQKAQEIGRIGTWELDVATSEMTGTDELYRIFGLPKGAALNRDRPLNSVHPDDREHFKRHHQASLKEKSHVFEYRLQVDGNVKWVESKAELECSETGAGIRATGVVQDIAILKTASPWFTASVGSPSWARRPMALRRSN
jgi:PAS domain-containing protein